MFKNDIDKYRTFRKMNSVINGRVCLDILKIVNIIMFGLVLHGMLQGYTPKIGSKHYEHAFMFIFHSQFLPKTCNLTNPGSS